MGHDTSPPAHRSRKRGADDVSRDAVSVATRCSGIQMLPRRAVVHRHRSHSARSQRKRVTLGALMDGGRGEAILKEFRNPLGSLRVLLTPSMFPGPGGIPLIAEFPAPADPAIGVPTMLWAIEETDVPAIKMSARASLVDALSMGRLLNTS